MAVLPRLVSRSSATVPNGPSPTGVRLARPEQALTSKPERRSGPIVWIPGWESRAITLLRINGRMARDCTIGSHRNCMGFQRKPSLKRLTVDSARCYTFATLFSGTMESPRVPYPTWRRTTTSSDPPRGSEDVFFDSMLKSAFSVVLSRSTTSTYGAQYASVSDLPAALLKNRFEYAVTVRKIC
jgi:hypothetical protein